MPRPTAFASELLEKPGDLMRAVNLARATYALKVESEKDSVEKSKKGLEEKEKKLAENPGDETLKKKVELSKYEIEKYENDMGAKSFDYKGIKCEKAELLTPWGGTATGKMEKPFRVLYSFDKLEKEKVIEIAFRGTVDLDLAGGKGMSKFDKARALETASFDAVFWKMPLGSGAWPFGVRRIFGDNEDSYAMAFCTAIQDVCATFNPCCIPCCQNQDDTHGWDDTQGATMLMEDGLVGVTASVSFGFFSAAMSVVPTIEAMLNKKYNIEVDERAKWKKMVLCAPQTGCTAACSFCTGFCCACVPGSCQICNACPAACGMPCEGMFNVKGSKAPPKDVTIRVVGHSLGGAIATICATRLGMKGWNTELITFGSPRVGNNAFAKLVRGAR